MGSSISGWLQTYMTKPPTTLSASDGLESSSGGPDDFLLLDNSKTNSISPQKSRSAQICAHDVDTTNTCCRSL